MGSDECNDSRADVARASDSELEDIMDVDIDG